MKKLHVLLLGLVAMFAFGAVVVGSASAAETLLAFWAVGGVLVQAALLVLVEGEILLRKIGFIKPAHVVCSFHAEGSIWPESLLEITEVLRLASEGGQQVGALPAEALLCTALETCEAGTDVEVRPQNLPWDFEAELVGTLFFLLLKSASASYEINCLVGTVPVEEKCEALAGTEVEVLNVGSGVESMGVGLPLAECGSEKEVGENEGLAGNSLTSSEGSVTVESE